MLAVGALFYLAAARYGAQAQTLRWPDAAPGTNEILWYSDPIATVVIALVFVYVALRPGKGSTVVLVATAALYWLIGSMSVLRPPSPLAYAPTAFIMVMVAIAVRRIMATEHA